MSTCLQVRQSFAMLQALLDCTDQADWETLARRRVCHFGYKFEYQVTASYPVWDMYLAQFKHCTVYRMHRKLPC